MAIVFSPALVAALAYALAASLSDLRGRIIPDWLNYAGLAAAVLAAWLANRISPMYLLFIALAMLFAYLLYRLGAWAGGDVKFFAGCAAWFGVVSAPDPLGLLTAFLAAAALALPVAFLAFGKRAVKEGALIRSIGERSLAQAFLGGLWTGVIAVGAGFGWWVAAGAVLLSFLIGARVWWSAPFFLAAIILRPPLYLEGALGGGILLFIVLAGFRLFLGLAPRILRRTVPVGQLREGDIPAASVYARGKRVSYWEPPSPTALLHAARGLDAAAIARMRRMPEGRKVADCLAARGLLPDEIRELKKLGVRQLMVKESLPFAPAIAAGFAIAWVLA